MELLEQNIQESESLGGTEYQDKQDEFPSILQEYDSGMEDTPIYRIGLIIPENTPEPEILVRRGMGDESAEYYKHLSATGEDAEE